MCFLQTGILNIIIIIGLSFPIFEMFIKIYIAFTKKYQNSYYNIPTNIIINGAIFCLFILTSFLFFRYSYMFNVLFYKSAVKIIKLLINIMAVFGLYRAVKASLPPYKLD